MYEKYLKNLKELNNFLSNLSSSLENNCLTVDEQRNLFFATGEIEIKVDYIKEKISKIKEHAKLVL